MRRLSPLPMLLSCLLPLGCSAVIDPGRHVGPVAFDGGQDAAVVADAGVRVDAAVRPDAGGVDAGTPVGECMDETECEPTEECVFVAPEVYPIGTCLTPCTSSVGCPGATCSLAAPADTVFEYCSTDCDPRRPEETCPADLFCILHGTLPYCQPYAERPEATQGVACGPGLVCALGHVCISQSGGAFVCREVCTAETVCPAGTLCALPRPGYGWCE